MDNAPYHHTDSKIFYWMSMIGIVLFALNLSLNGMIRNISIGVASVGLVLQLIKSRELPKYYTVGLGFLMLAAAFVATTLFAPIIDMQKHLNWFSNILIMGLVFIVIANVVKKREERYLIIWCLLISLAIGEILGIRNMIETRKHLLSIAPIGHINHTAMYIATLLTLNLSCLYFLRGNKLRSIILSTFFLLSVVSLFLTRARSSILGFIIFLIILPIIFKSKEKKIVMAILILILLILTAIIMYNPLRMEIFYPSKRPQIWMDAIGVFFKYPVTGIGFNQYSFWQSHTNIIKHTHNLFLDILVQSGIIGFVSVSIIFLGVINILMYAKKYLIDEYSKACWIAAVGALTITLTTGFFDVTFHSAQGIAFSTMVGLCASLIGKNENAMYKGIK